MPNRFKDATMRREYDSVMHMFWTKHRNLFLPNGERSTGSSVSSFFWQGYDGKVMGAGWDAASKKMIGYAYWRAGQDAKRLHERELKRGGLPVVSST